MRDSKRNSKSHYFCSWRNMRWICMSMWVSDARKTSILEKSRSTISLCKWYQSFRNCKRKASHIEISSLKIYFTIREPIFSAILMIWLKPIKDKSPLQSSLLFSTVHLSFWEIWGTPKISTLILTSWISILSVSLYFIYALWEDLA